MKWRRSTPSTNLALLNQNTTYNQPPHRCLHLVHRFHKHAAIANERVDCNGVEIRPGGDICGGRGGLARRLGGELLARGLASGALACGLLGARHDERF